MANDEFPFPFPYIVPVDPNLGRRVDAYFILRVLLGRGGMGSAYLAENEALAHIKCVVKLVHAEIARSPMALSRYKTEAEALSLLTNHDNIVKLHGIGVLEDGQLFLRFEYVDGTTLARYLTDHGGRLSLRKAAYFIFQMCAALQYAHDRGVIHRDLKPDNVMIENPAGGHLKERIKILDFGIAKVLNSLVDATASGMMMGTATFCAPEQMANAAGATGAADVFSLAQILYFMLTGTLPWGIPDSDVVIYHKQRTEPPACPPEDLVPPEVTKVIHRALSLVPEDRPTMHEFAIELACAFEGGTEILEKVVPDWVSSSPHDAQTLPHPVTATAPASAPIGRGGGLPPLNVVTLSKPTPGVTASVRPRALATPAVPGAVAALRSQVAPSAPATPHVPPPSVPMTGAGAPHGRRSPPPVMAGLPTGLISQRYAAVQEPPVAVQAPQVVVASEIELAMGTPGPAPYAHAGLPAVVVSNTQLSGLTSQPGAPVTRPPHHLESPPFVVLPGASQPRSRRKLMALGAAVCALAAAVVVVIMGRGSQPEPRPDAAIAAMPPVHVATPLVQPQIIAAASPDASVDVATPNAAPAPPRGSPPLAAHPAPASDTAALVDAGVLTPATPEPVSPKTPEPAATKPQARGRLTVHVDPFADVWIDGRFTSTTPIDNLALPVGKHRVRLVNEAGARDETIVVTIDVAQTLLVEKSW